jgi:membrane-associated protease RseP (regulator of RpoE activity)
MYDPAPKRGPLTSQERWFYGLFMFGLLALFIAEVFHDFEPIKLSALLVVLFWIPLLVLHEAGHAVAATLLGWYVGQIVIGMGRLVRTFRLGTAVVEIRLIPVEGFVTCAPRNLHLPQLKSACIYFAGPGVELFLAAAILFIIGPDRLLTKSNDYLLIVWQSLALASAAQGVLNLIPHSITTPDGERVNDGLGIIRSFLLPQSHYAQMIGRTYRVQQRDCEEPDPADWWKRDR